MNDAFAAYYPAVAFYAGLLAEPAASASMLPTWIAVATALVGIAGVATTLYMMRANKRKVVAEAAIAESQIPFAGGTFVQSMSAAAASLTTALSQENAKLYAKIASLEDRADAYERMEVDLRRQLIRERDNNAGAKREFNDRLHKLESGHKVEIQELKREIINLKKELGRGG